MNVNEHDLAYIYEYPCIYEYTPMYEYTRLGGVFVDLWVCTFGGLVGYSHFQVVSFKGFCRL